VGRACLNKVPGEGLFEETRGRDLGGEEEKGQEEWGRHEDDSSGALSPAGGHCSCHHFYDSQAFPSQFAFASWT
jgi:hypothetical protein